MNGYMCSCNIGYTGTNCDQNIDDCSPNSCQNGGTCLVGCKCYSSVWLVKRGRPSFHCQDGVNEYTCMCATGYFGDNCETDIDECATLPCSNGATCHVRFSPMRKMRIDDQY